MFDIFEIIVIVLGVLTLIILLPIAYRESKRRGETLVRSLIGLPGLIGVIIGIVVVLAYEYIKSMFC